MSDELAGGLGWSEALAAAVERAGRSVARVEARRRQAASGVVWSADGLVLTADHVLEREDDLSLGLPDGRSVPATLVGRDPGTDLALLRAAADGLTPIERGPAPRVGQLALVVGRPSGLETSLGIVSALGGPAHTRQGGRLDGFVRHDAVMYPGFSGGPLVDLGGRLLGLATSHFGRGPGGLAISLGTLERVATALQRHGRVKRGFLGIGSQVVALPEALRARLGADAPPSALLLVAVEAGGPAEQAGLLLGDLLVSLGDSPIRHHEDLRAVLGTEQVGQTITARVLRGGEPLELQVTVGERD